LGYLHSFLGEMAVFLLVFVSYRSCQASIGVDLKQNKTKSCLHTRFEPDVQFETLTLGYLLCHRISGFEMCNSASGFPVRKEPEMRSCLHVIETNIKSAVPLWTLRGWCRLNSVRI
jgi:hypothetical protein